MSSQRTWACQGPLPAYALPLPATALCEQCQLGLGALLLSGVRRWCTAWPIASRRGEAFDCHSHLTVLDPPARPGAGALALQLLFLRASESMGNHDSNVVGAGRVG